MGVRAVQGHACGLERFYDYLAYGPAGPDGKLNTADDLKDPFLELGMKREELYTARPGGAAEMSDEDAGTIRKAAAVLRDMAVNEIEHPDTRRQALEAMIRLRTALLDWSDCGGADWCLQELARHGEDPRHVAAWASAGQWAARGGACHLGGLRDFWQRLDAQPLPAEGRKQADLDRLRQELPKAAEQLAKMPNVVPKALKTVVLPKLDYRPPERQAAGGRPEEAMTDSPPHPPAPPPPSADGAARSLFPAAAKAPPGEPLAAAMHRVFGFRAFRPNQEGIVRAILEGRDVFAVMPTGGGKSLCYQLPAHLLPGTCVVVSPLISLMKDQVDAANANGLQAAFFNSSLSAAQRSHVLRRLRCGELDLLYLAPERLAMEGFAQHLAAA